MSGATVESVPPAATPFDNVARLAVAPQERERQTVARSVVSPVAEPSIDHAACAAWLAAAPARDARKASR